MEKEFLNTDQAALFLCVSKSKLMKLCMNRELTYHKAGRLNIFNRKQLVEYLERNTVLSADELKKQTDDYLMKQKVRL